jgi:hypothetical protein
MNGMEVFSLAFLFIGAVFVLVAGVIGVGIVKGISQWRGNQQAPLRSVDALVVSRRTDVRRHSGSMAHGNAIGGGAGTQIGVGGSSSTTYFVTFEEPSGDRRELQVSGPEFGQFAEGDRGHLMHQGTRYKGFTRDAR